MDIRKQIREAFIEMKVLATEKDYKRIRNKAHTMMVFIDDYWVEEDKEGVDIVNNW